MFDWIANPNAWIGLLTLIVLEIVLGVDNIIFISILAAKLPPEQRDKARQIGITLALVTRLLLLLSIGWVARLTTPLFAIPIPGLDAKVQEISGRDLILLVGGLFLIWKSVKEIHHKLEDHDEVGAVKGAITFGAVIGQIMLLDVIFSLDSVITAVGMVEHISVMVIAVLVSVAFMLTFAKVISEFVEHHPTVKMLALAFLVLIGTNLIAEGSGVKIPKGYTYFAMAFAVGVEMLNIRVRKEALRT